MLPASAPGVRYAGWDLAAVGINQSRFWKLRACDLAPEVSIIATWHRQAWSPFGSTDWAVANFDLVLWRLGPGGQPIPLTGDGGLGYFGGGNVVSESNADNVEHLYVEDLDFCREVVARGRTLRVNTRARIRHREGGTQPGDAVLGGMRPLQLECMTRGKVYFARKRLSGLRRLVALATICVAKPIAGVLRYGRVGFLPLYFRAVRDGFRLPVRRGR